MQQFEQLKCNNSLELVENMPVVWPGRREPTPLKVSNIIKPVKDKKAYAFTAKAIAFVSEGKLYVTPYSKEALDAIRNTGYQLREFHVPFSRGERPQGEYAERWNQLVIESGRQPVLATA